MPKPEDRISLLEKTLMDAYEALAWHDGLKFEPNDSNGRTIGHLIREAMGLAVSEDLT